MEHFLLVMAGACLYFILILNRLLNFEIVKLVYCNWESSHTSSLIFSPTKALSEMRRKEEIHVAD